MIFKFLRFLTLNRNFEKKFSLVISQIFANFEYTCWKTFLMYRTSGVIFFIDYCTAIHDT
jgi:hypothetical protein